MIWIQKLKKYLSRKNSSDSKNLSMYGIFNYNKVTDTFELLFVHKNLRAPIGLMSYDLEKLKLLSKDVELTKKGYDIVIRKIKSFNIEIGEEY